VHEVFALTNFDKVFKIESDLTSAVAAVR
jgi:hypothetical protein